MAKGRRKKKGVSKYKLSNVLLHYKQKNYATALKQLKSVKVRTHEQETVNWLKDYLPIAIAYEHFCKYEYQIVIDLLSTSSVASDKQSLLLGLSYLYLGKFQKAEEILKSTTEIETLSSFGFYYLLAIIYGQEVQDATTLIEKYASIFTTLDQDKQAYLKAILALGEEKLDSAKNYLSAISITNSNVQVLKHFIEETPIEGENADAKGLYKVLGKLPYQAQEVAYLKNFSLLAEELEGTEKANLQEKYGTAIQQLCVEGKALSYGTFNLLKEELPALLKSRFVYNQVVALYNQPDKRLKYVRKQIDNHAEDFFKVMESMDVYLATFDYDEEEDNYRSAYFWRNVNYYLENFHGTLSSRLINQVGWKIYSTADFFELILLDKKHGIHFLKEIIRKYDNILAFKMKDVLLSLPIPNHNASKVSLNIFSSEFFEDYQKTIILEIVHLFHNNSLSDMREEMEAMVDEEYALMASKVIKRDSLKIYLEMLEQFYGNIYAAFESYDIHPTATSVIEIMDVLTRNLVNLKLEEPQVDVKEWQERGLEIYKKIFQTHPQTKEEDTIYQTLKHIEEIPKLNDVLDQTVELNSVIPLTPFIEKGMINTLNRFVLISGLRAMLDNDNHTLIANYLLLLAKKNKYEGIKTFFEKEVKPFPLGSDNVVFRILNQFAMINQPIPSKLLFFVLQYDTSILLDKEEWVDHLEIVEKILEKLKAAILAGDLGKEQKKAINKLLGYIKEIGAKHGLNDLKRLHKELSAAI